MDMVTLRHPLQTIAPSMNALKAATAKELEPVPILLALGCETQIAPLIVERVVVDVIDSCGVWGQ